MNMVPVQWYLLDVWPNKPALSEFDATGHYRYAKSRNCWTTILAIYNL